MKITEVTEQKQPVPLRVWDSRVPYPWGPLRGENQRDLRIKSKAIQLAEQHAKPATIPYANLISVEHEIFPSRVDHYSQNQNHEPPFVYKHAGQYVLWNGTHRVSSRIKQGFSEGPVLIADLDQVLTSEGMVKNPEQFSDNH